jgi:hypothetical protein
LKTITATGKYTVSFNTRFGDEEVGDSGMHTIDHAGDDVDALAAEVIAEDPSFPMTFVRETDADSKIVGRFFGVGDDYPTALMVHTKYM